MESLLGEDVLIFCLNYIYTGRLDAVNDITITLKNPRIVYETGAFSEKAYKDAQPLHCDTWNISISAIESFGRSK